MKENSPTDSNHKTPTQALTRRKFLHSSCAAGVGLGIASQSLEGQQGEGGKRKELRVAIIGCGHNSMSQVGSRVKRTPIVKNGQQPPMGKIPSS